MKNLKKTLSMVLVIAMMVGILVTGAGAAFTDKDDINYTTAVEVMTGIGAINGYTDGTFKPLDTITRQEAAKMVAYAILTPTVAKMLKTSTSSFTDVKSTDWASPFIEYCVSKGIINGKGDNKFDPTGNVTGYELGKMLLCAAGYGKTGEYTGAQWDLNVAIDAIDQGIFTGTLDTDLSDAATREEAALYVFNALALVDQVVYDTTISHYLTTGLTIGEQKYGLDVATSNVNGVFGYTWVNGAGTALSSFILSENVIGTSTNGTSLAALTVNSFGNTKFMAALDANAEYYINGRDYTTYPTTYATLAAYNAALDPDITQAQFEAFCVAEQKAAILADATARAAKKGVIVNLINLDSDAAAEKVTIIEKTVYTVTAAPVVSAITGQVTIAGVGVFASAAAVDYPADLAKNDVVLAYTDALMVTHIEKAEVITATLTAIKGAVYTIGGSAYTLSGLTNAAFTATTFNVDMKYYLDNGGFVVAVAAATGPVAPPTTYYGLLLNYAAVEYSAAGVLNPTVTQASERVQFVDSTGAVKVLDTAFTVDALGVTTFIAATWANDYIVTDAGNEAYNNGTLFSYTLNADGKIASVTVAADVLANGTTLTQGTAIALGANYADSSTVFFYVPTAKLATNDITIADVAVYTGYSAITTKTTTANGTYIGKGAVLAPVAAVAAPPTTLYAFVKDIVGTKTVVDATHDAWTFDVFIDGAATTLTVKVATGAAMPVLTNGIWSYTTVGGYATFTGDVDHAYAAADDVTTVAANFIVVNGAPIYYSSATKIYQVTEAAPGVFVNVTPITAITASVPATAPVHLFFADGGAAPATPATVIYVVA